MTDGYDQLVNSKEFIAALDKNNREIKDELQNVPETKAKLRGHYEFMENTIFPKFEQEIEKGVEQVAPFVQERSAGRPPNPKAGPGRPKEQEY